MVHTMMRQWNGVPRPGPRETLGPSPPAPPSPNLEFVDQGPERPPRRPDTVASPAHLCPIDVADCLGQSRPKEDVTAVYSAYTNDCGGRWPCS